MLGRTAASLAAQQLRIPYPGGGAQLLGFGGDALVQWAVWKI
jgi:hypothetical protein